MKKLLVIQVAALGHELLKCNGRLDACGLSFAPAISVFPAVTCVAQASFRTAAPPAAHGMVSNGVFCRRLHKAMFWEQSADLVEGERIWSAFRRRGGRVGLMFWQQSLGEQCDLVLSPAPIHKHHGHMIEDCYSRPAGLYERLCQAVGGSFKLRCYWGPLASARAGDWIARATAAVMDQPDAPELLLTYLPSLDYDLQRYGPAHARSAKALAATLRQIDLLARAAAERSYELLVFGDYAIAPVSGAALPNVALRQAGLLPVREVGGMTYFDPHAPGCFAMADHEVAHVYLRGVSQAQAQSVLEGCEGVERVLDRRAQRELGLDHPNSGELVLLAREGWWIAYPWWRDAREAPDYARHIDIHNKPGYDPCELFFGWPPGTVSMDVSRVRGAHGRADRRPVAWGGTFAPGREIGTLIDLAAAVREALA